MANFSTYTNKYISWNKEDWNNRMTKHGIERCEERLLPRGREAIKCLRDMRHLKVINLCAFTRDAKTGRDAISIQSRNMLIVFCIYTGKIITQIWDESVEQLTAYAQQQLVEPISLKAIKECYPSVLHSIRALLIDVKSKRRDW